MGIFTVRPEAPEEVAHFVRTLENSSRYHGSGLYLNGVQAPPEGSPLPIHKLYSLRKNIKGNASTIIAGELGHVYMPFDPQKDPVAEVEVPIQTKRMPFPDTIKTCVAFTDGLDAVGAMQDFTLGAISKAVYNFANGIGPTPEEDEMLELFFNQQYVVYERCAERLNRLNRRE